MNKKLALSILAGIAVISGSTYVGAGTEIDLTVLPSGERLTNVILSSDNYTRLQNNVGVFAVIDREHKTLESPTHNYCPLALNIWQSHVGTYDKIAIDHEDRMIPRDCYHEYVNSYIGQHQWYHKVIDWFEEDLIDHKTIENGFEYLRGL